MNLVAGSAVVDVGGDELGELAGVSVNLATNQVAELLISTPSAGFVTLVPAHLVSRIDDDVQLTISGRDFRGLTRGLFSSARARGPHATALEFARALLPFGIEIDCADGPVGTLARVLCDVYTFDIEELVIGPGQWLDHEVAVPMDWVESLNSDKILLSSTRREVMTQPAAPEDR